MKNFRVFLAFLVFLSPTLISPQVKLKELPVSNGDETVNLLVGKSSIRKFVNLDHGWSVHPLDNAENVLNIDIPSNFEGETTLVYEKGINLSQDDYNNFNLRLHFMGANYYSEILINNNLIAKNSSDIPFDIDVPKDLIKPNFNNVLTVKVFFKLDSENTIPFKQRFLGPKDLGGLIRDVILEYVPNNFAELTAFNYSFESLQKAKLNLKFKINFAKTLKDQQTTTGEYKILVELKNSKTQIAEFRKEFPVAYNKNLYFNSFAMDISAPELWRPDNPTFYYLKIQLSNGKQIIDESEKTVSFYDLNVSDQSTNLNGSDYFLTGTTYYISNSYFGNIINTQKLREELTAIKNVGFNSVRFAKAIPNPVALKLCEEIGLFAFIELPLNSIPNEYADNQVFLNQAKNFLNVYLDKYNNYSAVCAFGVGSSYLPESPSSLDMIKTFAGIIKSKYNKLVYASFVGFPKEQIENIDLYGVELYGKQIKSIKSRFEPSFTNLGKSRIFISEATYPVYKGVTSGYVNEFSSEGQALYFSGLIDFSVDNSLTGYFINSLYDYAGDFNSFYSSYNGASDYNIGILGRDKNEFSLPYKVLYSKLHDGEKVTIPIGTEKNDAKNFFIIVAFILIIIMAILINTKRKFREDCLRALFRPYNFFADIRDRRILSGIHSAILLVILLGSVSLLFVNLLYYLKADILVEKIFLSFGSRRISSSISYLAWNPVPAFFIIMFLLLIKFGVVSLIIKIASFFTRIKVSMLSIVFMMIWALLPMSLFTLVELILYKVLAMNFGNIYIYIIIAVYMLWVLQRVLKGIYVIFDTRPLPVFFYSIVFIFLAVGSVILFYQFSNSAIYFIINAFRQTPLM